MEQEEAMKVNFYIMGQYRGVTEVDDNSLCGCLIRRDFGGATKRAISFQKDIDRISTPEKPRRAGTRRKP
jgi:hypothetical protein